MDLDEDLWNIIENVRRAESANDLCKSLKDCLGVLESKNTNKRKFVKYLNEYLANIGGRHRLDALFGDNTETVSNVYVHDYKKAPVIYASHRLISTNKISDCKVRLHKMIEMFELEFLEPKTAGLSREQVYEVIDYLQSRYRLFDIITCKTELEIFLFNNSHIQFNSICEVFSDPREPETYCKRYILTFASRSEEHDPYQVLLHEIGHALQVALTHQVMIVPESFIKMNKVLNVHLENNKVASTDVFADIFAVVAMNKSYLSDHNDMIRFFPSKVLDLFERYFTELIDCAFGNREELKTKKLDIIWSNDGKTYNTFTIP